MNKKITLEDIFNDDELGILDSRPTSSNAKTEDERLIESFQEINSFFEKNSREPEATNVTEFKLLSRLKALKQDAKKIEVLKQHDAHNLLKTKAEVTSVADILNDDDLGILDTDETLSIFKLQHVPSSLERAETDFMAQRKAMKDGDFSPYETLFKKVHKDLRERRRKLFPFENAEKNLKPGAFYVLNGVLLFLEEVKFETENISLPSGNRIRKDGRTRIIFENCTMSNMLYRSLEKALLHQENDGKIVSYTETEIEQELFDNVNALKEEDQETGWIYILKSKSTHKELATIKNLYKIGYSTIPVAERIKNASKESTYLMADVHIEASYKTYNMNAQKFESLIHRFFAEACLDIDIHDDMGRRMTPREWFVVPLPIIDKAIHLIISGEIVDYGYDSVNEALVKR